MDRGEFTLARGRIIPRQRDRDNLSPRVQFTLVHRYEVSLDARSQSRLSSHRERKKEKERPPSGAVNDSLNREGEREGEREREREATAKDIGQFPGAEGLKVYQDKRPSRGSIGYIEVGTT